MPKSAAMSLVVGSTVAVFSDSEPGAQELCVSLEFFPTTAPNLLGSGANTSHTSSLNI